MYDMDECGEDLNGKALKLLCEYVGMDQLQQGVPFFNE